MLHKNFVEELDKELQIIFKISFSEGETPDGWREPLIIPLIKMTSKLNAENNRPGSLISIFFALL